MECGSILDLDRMRAHNVSSTRSRIVVDEHSHERSLRHNSARRRPRRRNTSNDVLSWRSRYNKPEQYENIVLKATPEGEILRLKDVAKVEMGSSFYISSRWGGNGREFHSHRTHVVCLAGSLAGRRALPLA